ncbi:unnamed protein product [Trichogramma brassicae]|uniref:Uncharacterized protein n=1 Tax=Trichogramma brassicae TaxID=86971 RepID=A0A6H5IKL1_9HYME|nr:unnamed protein product [Trichogramma brassicae]
MWTAKATTHSCTCGRVSIQAHRRVLLDSCSPWRCACCTRTRYAAAARRSFVPRLNYILYIAEEINQYLNC